MPKQLQKKEFVFTVDLLNAKKEVLLIKKEADDNWQFPGGEIYSSDKDSSDSSSLEETLELMIKESLNLEMTNVKVKSVGACDDGALHLHFWASAIDDSVLKTQEPNLQWAWFSEKNCPKIGNS